MDIGCVSKLSFSEYIWPSFFSTIFKEKFQLVWSSIGHNYWSTVDLASSLSTNRFLTKTVIDDFVYSRMCYCFSYLATLLSTTCLLQHWRFVDSSVKEIKGGSVVILWPCFGLRGWQHTRHRCMGLGSCWVFVNARVKVWTELVEDTSVCISRDLSMQNAHTKKFVDLVTTFSYFVG